MRYRFPLVTAWIILIAVLSACSSTTITGVWKKSDYLGPAFKSVLVIALTEDSTNKTIWEDKMAAQLLQSGVEAITSSNAFAGDDKITKEEVLAFVRKNGTEAVLVTRLIDIKKEQVYYPSTTNYAGSYYGGSSYGYYNSFGSYYPRAYNTVTTPGYTASLSTVLLESNLYQASSQDLVWSLSSETFEPRSVNELVESVGAKLAKSLRENNLI
jgi:hypothetical protein